MKQNRFKNLILYIVIVVIPSIIGIFYFTHAKYNELVHDNIMETKKMVELHKNHIEQFIGETVTSLEMLSLVLSSENELLSNNQYIKDILVKTYYKDPRFFGLYLANPSGKIITGTRDAPEAETIVYRDYFQTAVQTRKTSISEAYYHEKNDQYIVTIASPVFNRENEIQAFLVADLRLDYIENIIKLVNPDLSLKIYDMNHAVIAETKQQENSDDKEFSVTSYLNNISWMIAAKPLPLDYQKLLSLLIVYILLTLVITHIIFLLIKYILLKRKTTYERMQNETQKLELVGTLAASTAHEIRNPLTGIKGFIQLLSEKYKDEEAQLYFSIIKKEINRINQIVSELLMLGKPSKQKFERHDLRKIIEELSPIIDSQAHLHNVVYQTFIEPAPLTVFCSKDHIKQVILNLTKNALEAMPLGGVLTISLNKEDDVCKLEISDTGQGIPEEALSKIFTPFFTMKDTGTGLGLVVCQRIVHMHKGKIDVKSKVDEGTVVSIYLPISKD
ncbi:ATP-binding protein [Bacillus alveayuensis]|jgi:two-component system, sporulation sensor kinase D|uniref:ATP-binding protein n=1 Tax=Aeribacillus alveayuensis TaxID=279215 RepID=UPI0005D1244B|nr:ATP-binding protein [Bacillus alveayuensis]